MPAAAARAIQEAPLATRGRALAKSVAEVESEAEQMLGSTLVTHPDRPAGQAGQPALHRGRLDIDKEFYLSLLVDRETSRVAFVVSTEGGMDIEEVAHKTPEKIVTFSVDPATGDHAASRPHRRPGARA